MSDCGVFSIVFSMFCDKLLIEEYGEWGRATAVFVTPSGGQLGVRMERHTRIVRKIVHAKNLPETGHWEMAEKTPQVRQACGVFCLSAGVWKGDKWMFFSHEDVCVAIRVGSSGRDEEDR